MPIQKSLKFWTLIAGLLAFTAKFYFTNFPFDEVQIIAGILFLLGLFGLVPTVRAGLVGGSASPIYKSMDFWKLVAGLLAFAAKWYASSFPFTSDVLLAALVFLLGLFGINPELRARGLMVKK
jgi:hypothetical protein